MGLQRHSGIMRGGQRGCSTSTELTGAKEFKKKKKGKILKRFLIKLKLPQIH